MITVEITEIQNNFGTYFNRAAIGEAISISDGDRDAVLLSVNEYKKLENAYRNAEYMSKLDASLRQLAEGNVVIKTMEELEEMAR